MASYWKLMRSPEFFRKSVLPILRCNNLSPYEWNSVRAVEWRPSVCLLLDDVFPLLMSFYLPGSDLCTRSFRSNTSGMLGMTSELFFVSSSSVGEGRGEAPKDIFRLKKKKYVTWKVMHSFLEYFIWDFVIEY